MKLPLSHDCPPFSYLRVSCDSLAAVAEKYIIRGWDFCCLFICECFSWEYNYGTFLSCSLNHLEIMLENFTVRCGLAGLNGGIVG